MGAQTPMALNAEDLNPTDKAILDELHDGRVTPAFVANKHGYTGGNVRNRITNLAQHDHVKALDGGLYELVDDPRGGAPTADSIDPETVTEAIGYLDTALERIPEETPGRTQVLDAQLKLKEEIDDARHPE